MKKELPERKSFLYRKGRAWIELNKENLFWNVEQFRKILPDQCRIMPAVKANAYGHGSVEVAGMLQEAGITDFCVATLTEGIELRRAGISGEILILGYTHPALLEEVARFDLTQTVVDSDYADELQTYGGQIKVHIGVDTGMHRLGERFEQIDEIRAMWNIPNLRITGIYSHLCVADSNTRLDKEFTLRQIRSFQTLLSQLKESGLQKGKAHLLGSYGVLNYPEYCYDYARIGIALYGILSSLEDTTRLQPRLRPVLSLKTRIESVRDLEKGEGASYGLAYTAGCKARIAALSVGYADGVSRSLSNTGWVLIGGQKAPVIGRICMDQMLVDVTGISCAVPGEEAVLIGKSGGEEISAPLFASWTNTIANEVLSRLGSRLERVEI